MKKRILLQTFLIITFLLSMQITYAPSSKAPEIQNKSQLTSDQSRRSSRIERRKQEKEEYLKRKEIRKERGLRMQAESSAVELVGMWPYGPCLASALDTNRNIAVIGNGEILQVLDISTPSSPSKIGEVFLQAKPWAISISGNYAYVLTEDSLRVIDISILSNPREVGNADIFYLGSWYGYALAVSSNYAYVADLDYLRIFDISNPTNPTEVGTYDDYANEAWIYEVAIWGNYAFIINDYWTGSEFKYELRIIDITNPYAPTLTGTYPTEVAYQLWSINASAAGNAYFIQYYSNTSTSEITIIDVATDPANPTEVGNYVESEILYDLEVSGNYAYYIDGSENFEIINISNPSNPFYVGGSDAPGDILDFSGSYVGIYGFGGFFLYDISDPSSPFQLGFYYTPDWAGSYGNSIAVSGDYAYIANYSDGLRIMDISSPYNPNVAGMCGTVYGRAGVVVSWNYAYGVDDSGFWIVDISSPSSPSQVGDLDIPWHMVTYGVAVSGNYAYVCGYQYVSDEARASLAIVDVSNPANPSLIGSFVCSTESYNHGGIAISGSYVYLGLHDYSTGSSKAGLKVIDISYPANPIELGSYVSADYGNVYDVEVRGNYAYLAGRDFIIVDVSNRLAPSEISSYRPPSIYMSYGVAISGDYAYLGYSGLTLIDISNPFNPSETGYYYNDLGNAVAVSGNYAYIPGSLYILKNILAPEVSITSPSAWSDVSGSVSIEAQASHSSGIARVEFYIDDRGQSTDSTSPYSYEWDASSVTEGPHKIRARAYNYNGKSSDFEIEVTVKPSWSLTISFTSGGTTDPEPGTYSYVEGTEVTITAIPETDYRFSGWTGDVSEGQETSNPVTITMDSDKSVTANFIRQYILAMAAGTGGTTDPSPGSHTYDSGTQVSVTARPNSGYEFSGWSGDASGTTNPITITMDSDKSITATFSVKPSDNGGGNNGGGGGCFIATEVYGSQLHPYVKILKNFRDKYLMPSKFGHMLIHSYYKYSPFIVNIIKNHKALKAMVRFSLLPMIAFSYSMLYFGPVITAVILIFIFIFSIFLILFFRRKMRQLEARDA